MYTMSSPGSYSREGVIFSMSVPRRGGGGSIERRSYSRGEDYWRKYSIQACVSVQLCHVGMSQAAKRNLSVCVSQSVGVLPIFYLLFIIFILFLCTWICESACPCRGSSKWSTVLVVISKCTLVSVLFHFHLLLCYLYWPWDLLSS